jgi:hypothetical protein
MANDGVHRVQEDRHRLALVLPSFRFVFKTLSIAANGNFINDTNACTLSLIEVCAEIEVGIKCHLAR